MEDITPKPDQEEVYLGDGVYARHDGYQIWLRTPRETGEHTIALEPSVIMSLCDYIRKCGGERLLTND
jgi:hypothetical protein